MKLIQIILLLGLGFSFLLYFIYLRSTGRDRLVTLVFLVILLLAVLFPDSTTTVAHFLGVGRGTDLAFYLFSIFIFFAVTLLHLKIKRMERSMTELTREIALNSSLQGHSTTDPGNDPRKS
jgi:hypothetical protein